MYAATSSTLTPNSWPGRCGCGGLKGFATVGSVGPSIPMRCITTRSAPRAASVAALNAWWGTRTESSVQYSRMSVTSFHGTTPSPPFECRKRSMRVSSLGVVIERRCSWTTGMASIAMGASRFGRVDVT